MAQTCYITISCENQKKEREFPTRIKLNHIGLPEGKGGNSFFSFIFFWGGGRRVGWSSQKWIGGGRAYLTWYKRYYQGILCIITLETSTVALIHSYYWSLIIHSLILWVCTICTIHLLMFSKKFVYIWQLFRVLKVSIFSQRGAGATGIGEACEHFLCPLSQIWP